MRYLISINLLFFLFGCNSVYKGLLPVNDETKRFEVYKNDFKNTRYITYVEILNNKFSGLLLIKKMPDSSTRILFSNEIGIKFFDFKFTKNNTFSAEYIMENLNKEAIVNTLKNDFDALLMNFDCNKFNVYKRADNDSLLYYMNSKTSSVYNYRYIFNKLNDNKVKAQILKSNKVITNLDWVNIEKQIPDSIHISHKKLNFKISLKHIQR